MTPEIIAAARRIVELDAKATKGPWLHENMVARGTYGPAWVSSEEVKGIADCSDAVRYGPHGPCLRMRDGENDANATFIAETRTLAVTLARAILEMRDAR